MENIATLNFPDARAGDAAQVNVRVSPDEVGLTVAVEGERVEVFMPLAVAADLVQALSEGLEFAGWSDQSRSSR